MPQQSSAERIAGNVRRAMQSKRINQTDLADALGRSQSAMSRRLLGRIPFSVDELDLVAGKLELPVSELFA